MLQEMVKFRIHEVGEGDRQQLFICAGRMAHASLTDVGKKEWSNSLQQSFFYVWHDAVVDGL